VDFIGVDLAWKTNPSLENGTAFCVMNSAGKVTNIDLVTNDHQILSRLEGRKCAWVGIDAPLIVNNEDGLRKCERSLFDRSIRVLPASRGYLSRKFGGCRGVDLADMMSRMGYSFPGGDRECKVMIEVYPYGALHVITGGSVPRYKKGKADERRKAALKIMRILRKWLPVSIPETLDEEIDVATPSELKSVMDKIDAVISVLCVYGHWIYAGKMTEVLGDATDGFILLPRQVI
jgi:predicted RNase H-like nuclease